MVRMKLAVLFYVIYMNAAESHFQEAGRMHTSWTTRDVKSFSLARSYPLQSPRSRSREPYSTKDSTSGKSEKEKVQEPAAPDEGEEAWQKQGHSSRDKANTENPMKEGAGQDGEDGNHLPLLESGLTGEPWKEIGDETAMMQRRKRGRSPSPRRRRRYREEEEARRAANRARWTIRGTPSRAPMPERTRTSSTRSFPKAPWAGRRPAPEEDEAVCVEETDADAAGSSEAPGTRAAGAAAAIPGLDDLDPRIRWWSDVIGLTNPMNSTEGLTVLDPDTTNTIISSLQDQGEIERARTVRSVLSFLGLFIAELLRAIHDAEHGDRVVLMQHTVEFGPGNFAKILTQTQEDVEKMGKARAKAAVKYMMERMEDGNQEGRGIRTQDRRLRLTALLVAYNEDEVETAEVMTCNSSEFEWEPAWLWAKVAPFLVEEHGRPDPGEQARGSNDAAGAIDEEDEKEGILVRRAPGRQWERATQAEAEEIRRHEEQLNAEAAAQEQADEHAFRRLQASKLQDWEDWAMTSEMEAMPERSMKRVRVVMVLGAEGGNTTAEGVLEGLMPTESAPMVTMTMSHEVVGPDPGRQVLGPPTPDTVLVRDDQIAEQMAEAEQAVDLDSFLSSGPGRRWFENWQSGQIDDEMVTSRWGKAVLELFVVTRTIEDNPSALDTQKGTGDASQGNVGYIKPEEEGESSGRRPLDKGDTEEDVMDEEDEEQKDEEVALMQKSNPLDFEGQLHRLLEELDGMAKSKAARLSHFLGQMLIDQRRHAPHLRQPKLADRHDRLHALLVTFSETQPVLRGDEMRWCHEVWHRMHPFLENAQLPDGRRLDADPKPSQGSNETIEVVDSQDAVEADGSRIQVAQLEDGTQRDLTEAERDVILENEIMEEMAAESLREEEGLLWQDFHAADLRTWEAWTAANTDFLEGKRKRARVQVLVQGEGGRIIKRENWLFGLGQGERLSYAVNIMQNMDDDEDDERDPTAAASDDALLPGSPPEPRTEDDGEDDRMANARVLPVTGEEAPDLWSEVDTSVDKDIVVDDFMATSLAAKFYEQWKTGQVTDRLIGQRFGYGVLGRFYSQRLWDQGCFADMEEGEGNSAAAPQEPVRDMPADGEEDPAPVCGRQEEDDHQEEDVGDIGNEEPAASEVKGAEGLSETEEPGNAEAEADAADLAASGTTSTEGSAAVATSATERAEPGESILSGSRQTSLAHWLL